MLNLDDPATVLRAFVRARSRRENARKMLSLAQAGWIDANRHYDAAGAAVSALAARARKNGSR